MSLSCNNMEFLKCELYSVMWKVDGTCYLLMFMRDGTYLIDRKFVICCV